MVTVRIDGTSHSVGAQMADCHLSAAFEIGQRMLLESNRKLRREYTERTGLVCQHLLVPNTNVLLDAVRTARMEKSVQPVDDEGY